jgi:hypothetical protein
MGKQKKKLTQSKTYYKNPKKKNKKHTKLKLRNRNANP